MAPPQLPNVRRGKNYLLLGKSKANLTRYIIRKLLYGCLVLFGVITVVFFLFYAIPGDPARMLGGQHATEDALDAINKDLGLDLPIMQQYGFYLNDLSPISVHNELDSASRSFLDGEKYTFTKLFAVGAERVLVLKYPHLRRSYQRKQKVSEIIANTFPTTAILAITAIIIATFLGIFLGIIAAINKDTFFDRAALIFAVLGMSGPSYFMGLIFAWVLAYLCADITYVPGLILLIMGLGILYGILFNKKYSADPDRKFSMMFVVEWLFRGLGAGIVVWLVGVAINGLAGSQIIPFTEAFVHLPGTGLEMTGSLYTVDDYGDGEYLDLKNLVLPAVTLGIRPLAIVVQLTRSSMLDVLSQDYIRTATAKGLSRYRVIAKHALKNALNPVITAISGWFASLLAGAVLVERVFDWKGIGNEIVTALEFQDMPVVMGAVLFVAIIFVIINILVDILYGVLDPRVRFK